MLAWFVQSKLKGIIIHSLLKYKITLKLRHINSDYSAKTMLQEAVWFIDPGTTNLYCISSIETITRISHFEPLQQNCMHQIWPLFAKHSLEFQLIQIWGSQVISIQFSLVTKLAASVQSLTFQKEILFKFFILKHILLFDITHEPSVHVNVNIICVCLAKWWTNTLRVHTFLISLFHPPTKELHVNTGGSILSSSKQLFGFSVLSK